MQRTCAVSGKTFTITDEDQAFYQKMGVPVPTLCPEERSRRRMTWRNERGLHWGTCAATGKRILSMYRPESGMTVYDNDYWFSDRWDPFEYGRDFDFSKPFFPQFEDLMKSVPVPALEINKPSMENADYCNCVGYLKDCYMIYNSDDSERCFHSKGVNRCYDCGDCFKIYDCEACYESQNCTHCSFSTYLLDSHNCSDCHYGANLIGCHDCFGCVNLRNKQYYFLNEKMTKEAYEKKLSEVLQTNSRAELLDSFWAFRKTFPIKWSQQVSTQNCSGDSLVQCRDAIECYDCEYLERSKYCSDLKKGNEPSFGNYDVFCFGKGVTECYEGSTIGYDIVRCLFSVGIFGGHDIEYSTMLKNNCHDMFGCAGMKKASYCIFNKQYSEADYHDLKNRIIAHMKETGEYGEFFPAEMAPFPYEETAAGEYFPQEEFKIKNAKCKIGNTQNKKGGDGDILNKTLTCEATGKSYKIQKMELEFYQKMKLPIPQFCPNERHRRRMELRAPRTLQSRICSECGKDITTNITETNFPKVVCEACYAEVVD